MGRGFVDEFASTTCPIGSLCADCKPRYLWLYEISAACLEVSSLDGLEISNHFDNGEMTFFGTCFCRTGLRWVVGLSLSC